ncbi:CpaD family pilus assembly protein [Ancylobacter terrae]|uniref:CpaD family pilus assembly protein n=1 Tax=Ancylobacter sp. sgz301288 TaxID=3342077 RepID=UPI00385C6E41
MTRPIAAMALLATLAGACTPQLADREITGSISSDYRVNHPIRMVDGQYSIDLFVGAGRGGLTPDQRAQVAQLAGMWRRESSGALTIFVPSGTPNERTSSGTAREVRSMLTAYGVPAGAIHTRAIRPQLAQPGDLAPIRLVYSRVQAEVDGCGLWPDDLGPTMARSSFENRPYYNFGCSTQKNLAAMVANPEDLVQPRPETPPWAARRQTVIEAYTKGQDPSTVYVDSATNAAANVSNAVGTQ